MKIYSNAVGTHPLPILFRIALICILSIQLLSIRPVSADTNITIVDTLGQALPTTQFDNSGAGGTVIASYQFFGPKFVLTQPTLITEIGAFLNNCGGIFNGVPECPNPPPIYVQIWGEASGFPDPSNILGTFQLPDDQDPFLFSYKSVNPQLRLEPGTYFALFVQFGGETDAASLLNNATFPFLYQAEVTQFATVFPLEGRASIDPVGGAVRILGELVVQTVAINIKPGSAANLINKKSNGVIPVAILSTPDFNAAMLVDQDSLTFGRTGNEVSLAHCSNDSEDVNGDGLTDLVCHFAVQRAGFQAGDTSGILKGQTLSGVPIQGSDTVKILN